MSGFLLYIEILQEKRVDFLTAVSVDNDAKIYGSHSFERVLYGLTLRKSGLIRSSGLGEGQNAIRNSVAKVLINSLSRKV
jgi:hypothetical protein